MEQFSSLLFIVALIGFLVFVALYHVDAGYGKMRSEKWGPAINNKIGWMLMECPVFFVMLFMWGSSELHFTLPYLVFFLLFELHYFQRSFVFPLLMKGNSKMPLVIMALSIVFNLTNGYIQGYWLFVRAAEEPMYQELYTSAWLTDWRFILGTLMFLCGMGINIHSDYIIRHLRKPGDSKHYLPKGGMYNYVTSANYFGEILEWAGWAVLTWSWAGFVFFWFTCANLVPRANSIWHKYAAEFPEEFPGRNLKRVVPFIY
ncbi:MAG: DUF1295 domain-containing protein [Paludibacteraceae bacterium]|nr:DUF1295 domain-containing protein [Paludibacteraceae bacterium]